MNGTQRPPNLQVELRFVAELRMFLARANRAGTVRMASDGTSSLGHVVESAGVPLTEVGSLLVNDRPARPSYQPRAGDPVRVEALSRPHPLPPPPFPPPLPLPALPRRIRTAPP